MARSSSARASRRRTQAADEPRFTMVHPASAGKGPTPAISPLSVNKGGSYIARAPIMDYAAAKERILAKLDTDLPADRSYHSRAHTWDVYLTAIDIAGKEGVNGEDLLLLKTAALYHDSGFTEQDLDHEEASCHIARRELPAFGYTRPQVEYICRMIMATRIPQSPRDKLSRILCDADLDYLGREDFFEIAGRLYEELKAYGVVSDPREWNELQLRFLTRHRFFTRTNKRDREAQKQVHIAKVREWLKENS
jgi:predicted metal-dependent HD superfamily phosphohydrolase